MAAEKKSAHREALDTWLLIGAFATGISSAVVLKVLGLPPYVPAIAAGLVIILYAIATYTSSAARLEPEQIGDNCYYLGFCITLASLAYTLYALGSAGTDAALLGDVISGFGVALSSTVVGVMARVVLLQFRVDLAARDKEARSELNQVVRLFGAEMQKSVVSTRETITQIRQTLEEHNAATIASNEKMQASFDARIDSLVGDMVGGMKDAMQEVVESGKDMNKRLSASSRANITTAEKTMTEAMETITEALRQTTGKLETEMGRANENSVKALERIVMEVSAAINLAREEASKAIASSQAQHNAEMTKAVEAVAANVFEMAHEIASQKDKIAASLDAFTAETRSMRVEMGGMVKEGAAARDAVKRSADIATGASQKMSWAAERIEQSLQGSTSIVPAVSSPQDTPEQPHNRTPPANRSSPNPAAKPVAGEGSAPAEQPANSTQPSQPDGSAQAPRLAPQPEPGTVGADQMPSQPVRPAHQAAPPAPQSPAPTSTPPEPRRPRLGGFFGRSNR